MCIYQKTDQKLACELILAVELRPLKTTSQPMTITVQQQTSTAESQIPALRSEQETQT